MRPIVTEVDKRTDLLDGTYYVGVLGVTVPILSVSFWSPVMVPTVREQDGKVKLIVTVNFKYTTKSRCNSEYVWSVRRKVPLLGPCF